VLFGNGDGTFGSGTGSQILSAGTAQMFALDLNHDGKVGLILTRLHGNERDDACAEIRSYLPHM